MLFYIVILVACLIATFIVEYFYKAVTEKVRSADTSYQRITITNNSRNYQRKVGRQKACISLATQPVQEHGMVFTQWGQMSPGGFLPCLKLDTSWLIREKELLSMRESYKARPDAQPATVTLAMISKPFRREVSS